MDRSRNRRGSGLLAILLAVGAVLPVPAHSANASGLLERGRPVGSVFHIAKSENRNQVHYGVRVDAACRPKGKTPVYGYWRDYEDGPKARSRLLSHEQPAYGLTRPYRIERGETGGKVRIGLRGFPDRKLTIETFKGEKGCRARAITTIRRQPAVLSSIYVELGFLFSIDYVLVKGVRIADGKPIREKVED